MVSSFNDKYQMMLLSHGITSFCDCEIELIRYYRDCDVKVNLGFL